MIYYMSFQLINKKELPFLNGIIYRFIHEPTLCEVLHVHNNDAENAFMFAVPTIPSDDSGISHIMEHSVLSGSYRYKVKSPFFFLEQGSCRTYLNASTYPDRTLYPGASLLKDDLFNLMSMSGDAVWFPLLKEDSFRQEGFHFQLDGQDNLNAAGVVYNEMKGVYSDKISLIENEIQKRLFPDMEYRYDSGGIPQSIPLLAYQDFTNFHKQFYRPEHTKIILYGNIDTEEYLSFIEKELLSRWKEYPQKPNEIVSKQAHLNLYEEDDNGKERIHLVQVPQSEHSAGEEGSIDITWMLGDSDDIVENGLLRFTHFVLLEIPGAPLRKTILGSGLTEDLSMLSGPSSYLRKSFYTIGCTGVTPKNYGILRDIIFSGLEEVIKNGIPDDMTQAALSRVEFALRERLNNTSGKIAWMSSIAKNWLYGGDPLIYADVSYILDQIKKALQKPRVLEDFIEKYFLSNKHRIIVAAKPYANYEEEAFKKEQALLTQLFEQGNPTKTYWQDMKNKIEILHNTPDKVQDIESIPILHKKNLPIKIEIIPHENIYLDSRSVVQWIPHLDNGIVHFVLRFDVTDLIIDEKIRLLLPTLTAALMDIGVSTIPYDEMSIRICLATGRIGANINSYMHTDRLCRVFINIWVGVLEEKQNLAFDLIHNILTDADFSNNSRLREIINEGKSMMRANLVDSGTTLAIMQAAQNYSFNAKIDNDWNGINQLKWTMQATDVKSIGNTHIELRNKIFTKDRLTITVTASSKLQTKTLDVLNNFVDKLAAFSYKDHLSSYDSVSWQEDEFGLKARITEPQEFIKRQAIILPVQVAFNALVLPGVEFSNSSYAHHNLFSRIISAQLLEKIRMGFGAYGARADILGEEALFVCYTYRDPNISKTFEIFEQVIKEVANEGPDERTLDSHIVGAVGSTLVQMSPQSKSKNLFVRKITGITDEIRQNIKTTLLEAQPHHIQLIAQQYVEKMSLSSIASVCNNEMVMQTEWDNKEVVPY